MTELKFSIALMIIYLMIISMFSSYRAKPDLTVLDVREQSGQTRFDIEFSDRSSVLRCGMLRIDGIMKTHCWWIAAADRANEALAERLIQP